MDRHHFTRLDQIDQLIEASEADADLGFMARLIALCSLPRTNPGDRKEYVRRNGPYSLYMTALAGAKLPYGNIPRLLLAWVCTEAARTQRRELVLGRSLYEFMRQIGFHDRGGGAHGERTRLRNQMRRLFRCAVSLVYEDAGRETSVIAPIADRTDFWWDERQPAAPVLWDSTIQLGEQFFGSPKVRVGHFARLTRGGCSSMLVQQSMIIPMSAVAEWKPKARRVITRTLLCSPSTMPLVTPQRI